MQAGDEATGETQAAAREPALKALQRRFAAQLHRLRRHIDRHITAALLMVAISILGAIAAFEVALAEQTSVGLERRLSVGQLEDAGFRQTFYSGIQFRVGLEGRAAGLEKETAELKLAKTGFFAGDGGASNWLDWRGAELRAQRNALDRFMNELPSLDDDGPAASVQIAQQSARELRSKGFAAESEGASVTFPVLEHALEKAHRAAPALAFCVLLFVAALVCLTIAELDFGSRRLWWGLAIAGVVLAFAGTIQMALIDPVLWIIAPVAVALCAVLPFAIRWGLFSRKGAPKPELHPENPEPVRPAFGYLAGHSGPGHDNWSRGVVLLIAVAVFFSAVFAWAYSVAVKEEGVAALDAQQTRTEFVTRQGTATTLVSGGIFNTVILAQAIRIRCAAATQFATLIRDGVIPGRLESAEGDREGACGQLQTMFDERRKDVYSAMDNNDLIDSAAHPARALRQDFMNRADGPNEFLALSDAKTAISARWSERSARYLAVLTVLAIVLFLFAQAHSMGRTSAGRLLRGAGIGLLAVSLTMGAFANLGDGIVAKAKKETDCVGDRKLANALDVAKLGAEKYRLGVAAYDRGETATPMSPERDQADVEALSNLKCATLLLPDFMRAYQRYHLALARIGSPERDEDWRSLADRAAVKPIHENLLAELRASSRAGLIRSSGRLSDFAFNATVYALVEGNEEALRDARTAVDALVRRDDGRNTLFKRWQRPELFTDETAFDADWFNLGLLELASGDEDLIRDAPRLYDLALAADRRVTPRHAASALVDLEMLRSYCSNLHRTGPACARIEAAIDLIRGRVASLRASTGLPVNSPATADNFVIEVTPYSVEWSANLGNFDPQRDRLSVVWYRDETPEEGREDSGWRLRRPLQPLLDVVAGGEGRIHVPTAAGYCLRAGRYSADLLLNGVLVGSAAVDLDAEAFSLIRSRELGLIGCAPSTWERYGGRGQEWRPDTPARIFVRERSNLDSIEAIIATFYAPEGMSEAQRRDYFLRRSVQLFLEKGQAGSQWSLDAEDVFVKYAVNLDDLDSECPSQVSIDGPLYRMMSHASDPGLVHVLVVNGDEADLACSIIRSFASYSAG